MLWHRITLIGCTRGRVAQEARAYTRAYTCASLEHVVATLRTVLVVIGERGWCMVDERESLKS